MAAINKYRETCFFCCHFWGECTCEWPACDDENADGFDFEGTWITKPNVSVCTRFFVNPVVYYGAPYIEFAKARSLKVEA